jgi:hypothetical protein
MRNRVEPVGDSGRIVGTLMILNPREPFYSGSIDVHIPSAVMKTPELLERFMGYSSLVRKVVEANSRRTALVPVEAYDYMAVLNPLD